MGPDFGGRRVAGMRLLEYVRWADDSRRGDSDAPLALPPVQRSSLWRPGQVMNLWRSLLSGMPVGAFYLAPPSTLRRPFENADGRSRIVPDLEGGWDLLDGQQRTNAMLLAHLSPAEAGKCVWLVVGTGGVEVRLTTRDQPFGYRSDDGKLLADERRKAREKLEDDRKDQGGLRGVEDHDLYDMHL